jgi:ribosome-associated translation inhibitor RaiA
MQVDIQCRGFELTEGLREHVRKRLACSLPTGGNTIQHVTVRLSDINGPRGGADKRCHIALRLNGLPRLVIEDTEADLYVAIDRAAGRAGRTLARRLARRLRPAPGFPALAGDA